MRPAFPPLALSVLLLAGSLGLKVAAASQTSAAAAPARLTAAPRDFLTGEGFAVAAVVPFDDYALALAYRGSCRLRASVVPAEGFATRSPLPLADGGDRVVLAFDGALYADHPAARSLLFKYADRALRGLNAAGRRRGRHQHLRGRADELVEDREARLSRRLANDLAVLAATPIRGEARC